MDNDTIYEVELVNDDTIRDLELIDDDETLNVEVPNTADYDDLLNKPRINSHTLSGNKTSSELGLQDELVSGTNIKTINSQSILGSGDISIDVGVISVNTRTGDVTITGVVGGN